MTRQDAEGLLDRLGDLGVQVSVRDGEIKLSGTTASLDDDLVDQVRRYKAALLDHLGDNDPPPCAAPARVGVNAGEREKRDVLQPPRTDLPSREQPSLIARMLGVPGHGDEL